MTFGSLFSGIGGFDLGFENSGMKCRWQVEIDRLCQRVLSARFKTKLHGDVRTVGKGMGSVDVICGGFPCQDLSVAGRRAGLGGERSGLFWEMLRIVDELQPLCLVFENVPGLLNSFTPTEPPPGAVEGREWEVEESSDLETVLAALAGVGFHGGWRVLDTQFFGCPQRRDRVFGVFARGRSGAGRAAEILALAESGTGNTPQGRASRQGVAGTLGGSPPGAGWRSDTDRMTFVAGTLRTREGAGRERGDGGGLSVIANTLTGNGHDASEDGTGRGTPLVAATLRSRQSSPGVSYPGRGGEDDANLVVPSGIARWFTPTPELEKRITVIGNGCWEWRGRLTKSGYGQVCMKKKWQMAHRWAYEQCRGPIPESLTLDHLCKNRQCVNPAHLEAVTFTENNRRSDSVGGTNGRKTHCKNGHPFDEDNAQIRPNGGGRNCRQCRAEQSRKRRATTTRDAGRLDGESSNFVTAFSHTQGLDCQPSTAAFPTLRREGGGHAISDGKLVRRLMPVECLRLQGFPDWWLDVSPPLSDGPKYRMTGNACSVPVCEWLGRRIVKVLS